MTALESMVAVTYVRDIDAARRFYELLGFGEHSVGRAATSGWTYLECGGHYVLLATSLPPLEIPRLPLLFYFFYGDLAAVVDRVRAAGVQADHLGHPPHALGGEVKLLDPDGNTVLIGQRERSAAESAVTEDASSHFSLLREAATLVAARGGTTARCQGGTRQRPCGKRAEVKLADTSGESAWACLTHADEILLAVSGAFIASPAGQGIAAFLAARG